MRTTLTVASALAALASLASAADNSSAIVVGAGASDISDSTWKSVVDAPTNATTSKFTGFDISKKFPSSEQSGWELGIDVKDGAKGSNGNVTATVMSVTAPNGNVSVDDSWHFCLYAFTVKATSATAYTTGQNNSCSNLVISECVDDLKSNAVKSFSSDGCKAYDTTASCLRDLESQTGKVVSISAKDAANTFGKNDTFYHRVDGDSSTFAAAAGQPMLVVSVFGSSAGGQSDSATAEAVCGMPNAPPPSSGASRNVVSAGWVVAALIVVVQLL